MFHSFGPEMNIDCIRYDNWDYFTEEASSMHINLPEMAGLQTGLLRLCMEQCVVARFGFTCSTTSLTPMHRTQLCNTESKWHLGTPCMRDLFENYTSKMSSSIFSLASKLLTFPETQGTNTWYMHWILQKIQREKRAGLVTSYMSFIFHCSKIKKYC